MDSVDEFINVFEEILNEHGFSQSSHIKNIYHLTWNNNPDHLITSQFIVSEPIDLSIHGSHNGNEIQAIGYFKFRLPLRGFQNRTSSFSGSIIPQWIVSNF